MFKIGSREIGGENLFFVIEEGQANLGDFAKAFLMVDAASAAGADAIEFQLARANDFYGRNDPGYELYLKREFSESQHKELGAYTKSKGIEFITVPLSHRLVGPMVKAGCSGFNINASDITNPDVIDAVSGSGLPFFLSLPLATEKEIDWAISRIAKHGADNYAILHGQHIMASSAGALTIENTSLGFIASLKEKYKVPVGFIDHTPLAWFAAGAVAAGADIVTKHLAISRKDKGPDWHICLEPDEMKESIRWAREMRMSMKISFKKLTLEENKDRLLMRRSIVASRKLTVGETIKREDIVFKRPGTGICPSRFEEIIGKTILREILPDEQIKPTDIGGK